MLTPILRILPASTDYDQRLPCGLAGLGAAVGSVQKDEVEVVQVGLLEHAVDLRRNASVAEGGRHGLKGKEDFVAGLGEDGLGGGGFIFVVGSRVDL